MFLLFLLCLCHHLERNVPPQALWERERLRPWQELRPVDLQSEAELPQVTSRAVG